jgi:type I restriction enzyme, R subunit
VRENLTEEELTVFDILTRPGPELSAEERGEIKKVTHLLLERLKIVLSLDWRKRVDARARVQLAIEDVLDEGLPRAYTPELCQGKCKALFEHVYENYVSAGVSTYAGAAQNVHAGFVPSSIGPKLFLKPFPTQCFRWNLP